YSHQPRDTRGWCEYLIPDVRRRGTGLRSLSAEEMMRRDHRGKRLTAALLLMTAGLAAVGAAMPDQAIVAWSAAVLLASLAAMVTLAIHHRR
ncbi:hypothetical protein, partial [Curtobacterium citreum]|uniref:hypothetical protein n=1 Tax=Curtobacterium citreum TaxID=2036 RepID=UPI0019D4AA32